MTIREILENTEARKIKLLQYAKDGNTVVTHHISAHPVVGNFYVYKTEPDEYGYSIIYVIAAFQCGYGVYVSTMPAWAIDMEKIPSKGDEVSPEGYFKTFFADYANEHIDKTDSARITTKDVYIVWQCKTLQNSKALLSTTLSDGMYYELTYNGDKKQIYLDAYKKWENIEYDI